MCKSEVTLHLKVELPQLLELVAMVSPPRSEMKRKADPPIRTLSVPNTWPLATGGSAIDFLPCRHQMQTHLGG